MSLDFDLTGHNDCCPICKTHLTSLYLCPKCGVRFGGWFNAEALADSLLDLLKQIEWVKEYRSTTVYVLKCPFCRNLKQHGHDIGRCKIAEKLGDG